MRICVKAIAAAILWISAFVPAESQMWETYAPSKEVWNIIQIKVQPNQIDSYLNRLRKSYVPFMEATKKSGVVLEYQIVVSYNPRSPGANILLIEKYADWASLAPNRERELAILAEAQKGFSKEDREKLVAENEKIRSHVDEGMYFTVEFVK